MELDILLDCELEVAQHRLDVLAQSQVEIGLQLIKVNDGVF